MSVAVLCSGLLPPVPSRTAVEIRPQREVTLHALLLQHLPADLGAVLREAILDGDSLKPGFAVLVDGRNVMQQDGLWTVVQDGATVFITAQVVGG